MKDKYLNFKYHNNNEDIMKKRQRTFGVRGTTFFITAILLITSMSTIAIASKNKSVDSLSMTYSFPTPMMSKVAINNDVYDQILVQGAPCSGDPGEPNLPTKGAYLLLPPNTKVTTLTVTGENIKIGTGYRIVPCGEPIPLIPHAPNVVPTLNPSIYSSPNLFPGSLFKEVGVYQFRGYTILVLRLSPVQYIPTTGDLFYYQSLRVTVTLQKETYANSLFRGVVQDHNDLLKKIDNPAVLDTYQTLPRNTGMIDHYDLMILTTDALKDGFLPLAEKHNNTGTKSIIRTLSDVGGTTPEDIRDYIRTAYSTLGINYVLLGGDTDVIPAKMLYVEGMDENVTPYVTEMPADLYYACLDGTYNYDGDDKWGEPHDGDNGGDVDLIAEVYVGRACASTLDEVNIFVQKTTTYLSLPENETYLGDATFAGEYLGDYGIASFGGTTLNQLINGSTENGYTTVGIPASSYLIDKLYDELYPGFNPNDPWSTGWPKTEIINRINNGVHLINHDGHAYYEYNMRMDTNDVMGLTNTNQFCFVYSQGCMSGGFDNPEGDDCIAEYFTVKTNHGAFAGIWNARYGFFWSYSTDGDSQRYHRQFWDAVFGENIREIGKANHESKEDNLFMINRSCMRWCYYETNLFGDPAVAFINVSGQKPQLSISSLTGGRGVVSATILNTGEGVVYGVPWSISIHGGMLGLISISSQDFLDFLGVGNTTTVQSEPSLFGLGRISITMKVKYAETWNGTGFVFGPFIVRVFRYC
jgi:hypothetical protein